MIQDKKGQFALVMGVLERVLLALVSAYAAYVSTSVSYKTDTNDANSSARLEALMETINTIVIPGMRNNDDKLSGDLKELTQDVSAYAERLARIEGIIEALPARYRRHPRTVPEASVKPALPSKPDVHKLITVPVINSKKIMSKVAEEIDK